MLVLYRRGSKRVVIPSHSKMQFDPKFVLLLCLSVLQCNGAPPKEVATKTRTAPRYTDEEDDLIMEELSRLYVDNQKILSRSLWESVADKVSSKVQQKAPGFSHERSWDALRSRFKYIIASNNPALKNKVPEHLLQRFRLDLNRHPRGNRPVYTEQEENFLIEELSNPSFPENLLTLRVMDTLRDKHDAKRLAKTSGFENARTGSGLRGHILALYQNGKLPDAVVQKFSKTLKGARSSEPSTSQPTHNEERTDEDV